MSGASTTDSRDRFADRESRPRKEFDKPRSGDRRAPRKDDDVAPVHNGPAVPEGADYSQLDVEARAGLRSLPKSLAEMVGRHLVAAGMLIDEDPARALVHARYARERASRVAIVREAAGLTAYHAGEWAEALSELRAVRRMSGGNTHVAVMADCERALGRPERALELAKEAGTDLDPEVAVELRIVSAGARRDMGQLDAAVVALQGPDLDVKVRKPWSARLFYAYADNLEAAGRDQDAIRWFLNAAQADDDEDTDAAERAFALGADESEIAAALPGETVEIEDDADDADDAPVATDRTGHTIEDAVLLDSTASDSTAPNGSAPDGGAFDGGAPDGTASGSGAVERGPSEGDVPDSGGPGSDASPATADLPNGSDLPTEGDLPTGSDLLDGDGRPRAANPEGPEDRTAGQPENR
ncbi:TPR-repeat-containing protein [Actinokineospora spheciospongiae]|uniref:TPR-repeat-containing protein n=1 Tax=Actinokineospora spheciospongiae TaxID=909613 RepID=W7IRL4_9PSEU|nr:TPR-repeat-containing protein [Actinokineospora spheciospongiae]